MTTEEKFDQIYQRIVDENVNDMEVVRREAQLENRHEHITIIVITIINRNFNSYIISNIFENRT